ncbi:hypothetical protein ACVWYH_010143 [Bradyrhizobium sp. GM24.11]
MTGSRNLLGTRLPVGLGGRVRKALRRHPEARLAVGRSPHVRRRRLDGQRDIQMHEGERYCFLAGAWRSSRRPQKRAVD